MWERQEELHGGYCFRTSFVQLLLATEIPCLRVHANHEFIVSGIPTLSLDNFNSI